MKIRSKQLIQATAAILFTLTVSFLGVRWLLADPEPRLRSLDPEEIRHVTQLREFESELVLLLDDFLARHPGDNKVEKAAFEDWTGRSFRPRVNDLQQRLFSVDLPRTPYSSLLEAADKVGAIASAPWNVRLRNAGAIATLEAVEKVERYIEELDLGIALAPDTPAPSERMRQSKEATSR